MHFDRLETTSLKEIKYLESKGYVYLAVVLPTYPCELQQISFHFLTCDLKTMLCITQD